MPAVGLGTWKIENDSTAEVVRRAAEIGYRHFDCASDYGNEREVGEGLAAVIRDGVCPRDDLWLTSKLWNTDHRPQHVRTALERTLSDLGLDRLDLYLIHFPIALEHVPHDVRYPAGWLHDPDAANPAMKPIRVPIAQTWRAMEGLVRAGLTDRIGVCNFGVSLLRDLLSYALIPPAVLQVESHPRLAQEKLLRFCQESGVAFTAFSPLGAQSYFSLGMAHEADSLLRHPVVESISQARGRSPAQVLLRWGVQRGTSVIPKSTNAERLSENLAVFDFELDDVEMAALTDIDEGHRYNDPGVFCEAAFNTFFPIYE